MVDRYFIQAAKPKHNRCVLGFCRRHSPPSSLAYPSFAAVAVAMVCSSATSTSASSFRSQSALAMTAVLMFLGRCCVVLEEEDAGAQGGWRRTWRLTPPSARASSRARLRRRTHLRVLQWHIHRKTQQPPIPFSSDSGRRIRRNERKIETYMCICAWCCSMWRISPEGRRSSHHHWYLAFTHFFYKSLWYWDYVWLQWHWYCSVAMTLVMLGSLFTITVSFFVKRCICSWSVVLVLLSDCDDIAIFAYAYLCCWLLTVSFFAKRCSCSWCSWWICCLVWLDELVIQLHCFSITVDGLGVLAWFICDRIEGVLYGSALY